MYIKFCSPHLVNITLPNRQAKENSLYLRFHVKGFLFNLYSIYTNATTILDTAVKGTRKVYDKNKIYICFGTTPYMVKYALVS